MSGKYTVEDLLHKAEEYLQSMETVQLAEKFYAKALSMEPNNTSIMDDYAECLLELDRIEEAAELIKKSIDQDPEGGYQKYMIAGQLASGIESLTCFNKGIEILKRFHEEKKQAEGEESTNVKALAEHISSAYCSMAEIFMTDCCFDEGAEEECTRVIEEAIQWNHKNAEAHLLRAQCLMSKSEPNVALPCVLTSYSLWKEKSEEEWPPYAVRVSTAKIFMELRHLSDATDLLEKLTHEDDEDSEVWYLLGLCYFNIADEDASESECLYDAKECLKKSLQLLQASEEPMTEAIEKVNALLAQTNEALQTASKMETD